MPGYEQKNFPESEKRDRLCLIASADGSDGSTSIHQDARVYASLLSDGHSIEVPMEMGRHLWIHVARGSVWLQDLQLGPGDGAAISEESEIKLTGVKSAELLLFDLG